MQSWRSPLPDATALAHFLVGSLELLRSPPLEHGHALLGAHRARYPGALARERLTLAAIAARLCLREILDRLGAVPKPAMCAPELCHHLLQGGQRHADRLDLRLALSRRSELVDAVLE